MWFIYDDRWEDIFILKTKITSRYAAVNVYKETYMISIAVPSFASFSTHFIYERFNR